MTLDLSNASNLPIKYNIWTLNASKYDPASTKKWCTVENYADCMKYISEAKLLDKAEYNVYILKDGIMPSYNETDVMNYHGGSIFTISTRDKIINSLYPIMLKELFLILNTNNIINNNMCGLVIDGKKEEHKHKETYVIKYWIASSNEQVVMCYLGFLKNICDKIKCDVRILYTAHNKGLKSEKIEKNYNSIYYKLINNNSSTKIDVSYIISNDNYLKLINFFDSSVNFFEIFKYMKTIENDINFFKNNDANNTNSLLVAYSELFLKILLHYSNNSLANNNLHGNTNNIYIDNMLFPNNKLMKVFNYMNYYFNNVETIGTLEEKIHEIYTVFKKIIKVQLSIVDKNNNYSYDEIKQLYVELGLCNVNDENTTIYNISLMSNYYSKIFNYLNNKNDENNISNIIKKYETKLDFYTNENIDASDYTYNISNLKNRINEIINLKNDFIKWIANEETLANCNIDDFSKLNVPKYIYTDFKYIYKNTKDYNISFNIFQLLSKIIHSEFNSLVGKIKNKSVDYYNKIDKLLSLLAYMHNNDNSLVKYNIDDVKITFYNIFIDNIVYNEAPNKDTYISDIGAIDFKMYNIMIKYIIILIYNINESYFNNYSFISDWNNNKYSSFKPFSNVYCNSCTNLNQFHYFTNMITKTPVNHCFLDPEYYDTNRNLYMYFTHIFNTNLNSKNVQTYKEINNRYDMLKSSFNKIKDLVNTFNNQNNNVNQNLISENNNQHDINNDIIKNIKEIFENYKNM